MRWGKNICDTWWVGGRPAVCLWVRGADVWSTVTVTDRLVMTGQLWWMPGLLWLVKPSKASMTGRCLCVVFGCLFYERVLHLSKRFQWGLCKIQQVTLKPLELSLTHFELLSNKYSHLDSIPMRRQCFRWKDPQSTSQRIDFIIVQCLKNFSIISVTTHNYHLVLVKKELFLKMTKQHIIPLNLWVKQWLHFIKSKCNSVKSNSIYGIRNICRLVPDTVSIR